MNSLIHFGMLAGVKCLDTLISYKCIKKYGLERESNEITRNYINTKGLKKGLIIKNIRDQAVMLGTGVALYGLDYLLKIEEQPINFHKGYLSLQTLIGTGVFLINTFAYTIIYPEFYTPINEKSPDDFNESDFFEEGYDLSDTELEEIK